MAANLHYGIDNPYQGLVFHHSLMCFTYTVEHLQSYTMSISTGLVIPRNDIAVLYYIYW